MVTLDTVVLMIIACELAFIYIRMGKQDGEE